MAATTPTQQKFEDNYRFSDVASSFGAPQWVVITGSGGTTGDLATNPLFARANFVNKRDHVYVLRSADLVAQASATTKTPGANTVNSKEIGTVFLVMSGPSASFTIDFGWLFASSSDMGLSQKILVEHGAYNCEGSEVLSLPVAAVTSGDSISGDKKPVAVQSAPSQKWKFNFSKKSGADTSYETLRGNIIFQQGSATTPVQTLQIPLVIANVCNDTAQKKPLLFKMVLRDPFSASKGGVGNIAASSTFEWDVNSDYATANDDDWILVAAKKAPFSSNVTPFQLETRITNYSGVRYALQRYDRLPLLNARWVMDIDEAERDVAPNMLLDELSHIPPGLTTIYSQAFDVTSNASSGIFQLYPVPQGKVAKVFRNLSFTCNNVIRGIEIATEPAQNATVTAFNLIPGNSDFLKRVAAEMGVAKLGMPSAETKFAGKIISGDQVAGDAIAVAAVSAKIPDALASSGDVRGLLPMQVTFSLPKSDMAVSKRWNELQAEWRRSGNIKDLFSQHFTVSIRNPKWSNSDLFKWLKSNKVFDKNVKVFMDEERGLISVSFIAMLMDGDSPRIGLVRDRSSASEYSYVVLNDGNKNNMWDLTFYCQSLDPVSGTSSSTSSAQSGGGSSGGGGCSAGLPLASLLFAGAALFALRKKR